MKVILIILAGYLCLELATIDLQGHQTGCDVVTTCTTK